jgi:hypothetical protein
MRIPDFGQRKSSRYGSSAAMLLWRFAKGVFASAEQCLIATQAGTKFVDKPHNQEY